MKSTSKNTLAWQTKAPRWLQSTLFTFQFSLFTLLSHASPLDQLDGENTSARYGQYRDTKYYLYHLDRLDYHLRWGNYSADIRPKPEHNGTARFTIGKASD